MIQRHHRAVPNPPTLLSFWLQAVGPPSEGAGEKRGGGSRHTGSSKWSIMSGSRCGVGGHAVMNCFAPRGQTGLHEPSVRAHTRALARSALIRVEGVLVALSGARFQRALFKGTPLRHEKSVKKPGDLWRSINQTAMAN